MNRILVALLLIVSGACAPGVAPRIRIENTSGLTTVEVLLLSACPTSAEELFSCTADIHYSVLVKQGEQTYESPPGVEAHAVAAVGYHSCEVRSYACENFEGVQADVVLRLVQAENVARCATSYRACTSDGACLRQCEEDLDGDSVPSSFECCPMGQCIAGCDTDADGVRNEGDTDSDGDGYADSLECPRGMHCDFDENGVADFVEQHGADVDGDGIPNLSECSPDWPPPTALINCVDSDRDGYADFRDRNSDNDQRTDAQECLTFMRDQRCPDLDEDGSQDFREDGPVLCGGLAFCAPAYGDLCVADPQQTWGYCCVSTEDGAGDFVFAWRVPRDARSPSPSPPARTEVLTAPYADYCRIAVDPAADWESGTDFYAFGDIWSRDASGAYVPWGWVADYYGPEGSRHDGPAGTAPVPPGRALVRW